MTIITKRPARGEIRTTIVEQATRLFAQSGFDGVSLRDISDAAGVGVSNISRHFPLKSQLKSEVVGRALDALYVRVLASLAAPGTAAERVDHLIDETVRWILAGSVDVRILDWQIQTAGGGDVAAVKTLVADRSPVTQEVSRALAEIGPGIGGSIDPDRFAEILFAIIYGVSRLRFLSPHYRSGNTDDCLTVSREIKWILGKMIS